MLPSVIIPGFLRRPRLDGDEMLLRCLEWGTDGLLSCMRSMWHVAGFTAWLMSCLGAPAIAASIRSRPRSELRRLALDRNGSVEVQKGLLKETSSRQGLKFANNQRFAFAIRRASWLGRRRKAKRRRWQTELKPDSELQSRFGTNGCSMKLQTIYSYSVRLPLSELLI